MRKRAFLSAAAACAVSVSARLLHSLPEDIHAFPKYTVQFLNGLPVLNETAGRWLKHGLRGGELEFLDQPWEDHHPNAPSIRKEIGSGEPSPATPAVCFQILCLLLPFQIYISAVASSPRKPTIPWSICEWVRPTRIFVSSLSRCRVHHLCRIIRMQISHLPEVGPCFNLSPEHAFTYASLHFSIIFTSPHPALQHRQGWFTYSYCHNDEIRQFREMIPAQARFPGNYFSLLCFSWHTIF